MPVLEGGRRNNVVSKVKQGEVLGGNSEGTVRKVVLSVRRKKLALAEKHFYQRRTLPPYSRANQPSFRNPQAQYEIVRELSELNRRHKLGLPLLPTFRLRKLKTGEKKLYLTLLENVITAELRPSGRLVFYKETKKETGILVKGKPQYALEKNMIPDSVIGKQAQEISSEKLKIARILDLYGYEIERDAWMYTMDPKTNQIKVWLGDFGNVKRKSVSIEEERRIAEEEGEKEITHIRGLGAVDAELRKRLVRAGISNQLNPEQYLQVIHSERRKIINIARTAPKTDSARWNFRYMLDRLAFIENTLYSMGAKGAKRRRLWLYLAR